MEHEVKLYRSYKRKIKFFLITNGMWPDYHGYPRCFKIFLSVLSSFSTFCVTVGTVNFCLAHITNLGVLTRGLGLTISYSSASFKAAILAVQQKNLYSLNRSLSELFEDDLKDPEKRSHLLHSFRTFYKFFKFLYFSIALNIIMMLATPLLQLRHGNYVRSYPWLIPFEYEMGGAVHWCIYGFELLSGYFCYSPIVGQDSLFGMYALQLVGEFRLLTTRFKALRGSCANKNYRRELKDCVDRHVLLIESHHRMQTLFGFLSVWLAITCAIVICAIIFQTNDMVQTKTLTTYRAIYLMCYCFIKLVQAYSYGWFGNIINTESKRCLMSIYKCTWAGEGDLRLMNDILIIQSQNPLSFSACSFMTVQLDMFSKIIQTSLSYFFLLQALDTKSA